MLPLAIDIIIIIVLLLYALDGYRRGFLLLALELIGTILTFYLAFRWANPAGRFMVDYINLPASLSQPIGFIALWLLFPVVYVGLSSGLYRIIPSMIRDSLANRLLGLIPSMAKGLVMAAVLLTLLVVLPLNSQLRPAILASRLGQPIVTTTQSLEQQLTKTYSQQLTETLTFLTNTPLRRKIENPDQSISLPFKTADVAPDPAAETTMLNLINQERGKAGVKPLVANPKLRAVARAHATDMLERGYFAHTTPDGVDPFQRMEAAGIQFLMAGENLAFAPTVELAHIGLMNSPGHRANILDSEFGDVGIGVIDAGFYGKMFVQEFTN